MSFASAEADRRIEGLLKVGRVVDVYPNGTARVQFGDDLTSAPLQVSAVRAGGMQDCWIPTQDEQLLVAAPSGDLARGLVVCSIFASNQPSSDVTTPMLDLAGGEMVIKGARIRIEADLEIVGQIEITGPITCDADVVASGISLMTHVHGGVLPGPAKTGAPE